MHMKSLNTGMFQNNYVWAKKYSDGMLKRNNHLEEAENYYTLIKWWDGTVIESDPPKNKSFDMWHDKYVAKYMQVWCIKNSNILETFFLIPVTLFLCSESTLRTKSWIKFHLLSTGELFRSLQRPSRGPIHRNWCNKLVGQPLPQGLHPLMGTRWSGSKS